MKQIETDVGKRLTTPQQIALRALKQAIDEHGQEAPDSNRDKDRAKQQAFKRATEDLLEAKRIGTWGEFFWVITE